MSRTSAPLILGTSAVSSLRSITFWTALWLGAASLAGCAGESVAPREAEADGVDAQESTPYSLDLLRQGEETAELLLLGTFHFAYPNLDSHQTKDEDQINILSAERQAELETLLEKLAAFQPSKIAVEMNWTTQERLDEEYQAFLEGAYTLTPNEIDQVAYRLAARLGHERVFAVDAPRRKIDLGLAELSDEERQARFEELDVGGGNTIDWDARYTQLYDHWSRWGLDRSLTEIFLAMNEEEPLRQMHGHYFVGSFKRGRGEDYLGPDSLLSWYSRNLRIFHNLQRITDSPRERILLLIGAGHVPILRHVAQASPEYDLVEVAQVLD